MAKMYASEIAQRSAADAVQVFGAAGAHRGLIGELEFELPSSGEGRSMA